MKNQSIEGKDSYSSSITFPSHCIKEWKISEKNIEFATESNFSYGSDSPLTANNPMSTKILPAQVSLGINKKFALKNYTQRSWKIHIFGFFWV